MLEKKVLKNSLVTIVDYNQLLEYRDEVKKVLKKGDGWRPDYLPKKVSTEFLARQIQDNFYPSGDAIVVFGFYYVDKDSLLVFSDLGVSVLTKEELKLITK